MADINLQSRPEGGRDKSGTLRIHAKGGGEERVFLNPRLVGMLGRFLKESRPDNGICDTQGPWEPDPAHETGGTGTSLFRSRSGRCLGVRAIQLKFARWVEDAGILPASGGRSRPVSVHSLRHTFATRSMKGRGASTSSGGRWGIGRLRRRRYMPG